MEVRLSGHGAYHHQYHVVWIPKYRKKILQGKLKEFIEKRLFDVQEYHPDIEIEKYSIQKDHIHLVIIIPPRYSVSGIIGKIKANTSREIRKKFESVKKYTGATNFGLQVFSRPQLESTKTSLKNILNFKEKPTRAKFS